MYIWSFSRLHGRWDLIIRYMYLVLFALSYHLLVQNQLYKSFTTKLASAYNKFKSKLYKYMVVSYAKDKILHLHDLHISLTYIEGVLILNLDALHNKCFDVMIFYHHKLSYIWKIIFKPCVNISPYAICAQFVEKDTVIDHINRFK